VPFSPLGKGFLTGSFNKCTAFGEEDMRPMFPRFSAEAMDANQIIVEFVKSIAKDKDATPAQIALAWVLAQRPWIVPIPGTTKVERLDENLGSVEIDFTSDEIKRINDELSRLPVTGDRYPEEFAKRVGK
jgi:aryl-alcohol dehydrogenase-like predicted oxidoreductase